VRTGILCHTASPLEQDFSTMAVLTFGLSDACRGAQPVHFGAVHSVASLVSAHYLKSVELSRDQSFPVPLGNGDIADLSSKANSSFANEL
jgi:hypothetical protein